MISIPESRVSSRNPQMEASVLHVRDRFLIHQAVQELYTDHNLRTASWAPPPEIVQALAEGFWEPRVGSSDREAALGILRGVKRLLGLLKGAGSRAWAALSRALGLEELEGLGFIAKVKAIAKRAKDLVKRGKAALGKVLKKVGQTFPLSMFFVPKNKMPGLTDLVARILQKSPRIRAFLERVKGGAAKVDTWLKKYVPRLSRGLYAAIFIYVWMQVSELSWDIESILAGFTGNITLGELLASLPESALGLLAASFGLGYGALPYVLIARLVWLVANQFISWVPGKGFAVHWPKMGVQEREELVPV